MRPCWHTGPDVHGRRSAVVWFGGVTTTVSAVGALVAPGSSPAAITVQCSSDRTDPPGASVTAVGAGDANRRRSVGTPCRGAPSRPSPPYPPTVQVCPLVLVSTTVA